VAVGASEDTLKELPIEVRPWSEESEVQLIQKFDIGIMPLEDSPWERGKCGYKLIQYMACGLPVVASPVGVNKKIVDHEVSGFLAHNLNEWEQMLGYLLNDQNLRQRMGEKGRSSVESWYSTHIQAPRLEKLMSEALK
ncbi:MAG: glycosyltransferase family 4 protein, partial [Gammaproteobacteria bacterium]|nr:glycosyltransferase family 4 protein [Gammaproteobacteria bacterium]